MTPAKLILTLHIIFGIIAFTSAPGAMMSKKGSLLHKRFGITFFYAMMGVAFSAFILWTLGAQLFLMLIAVFSFYLAFSGYRAVKLKNHPPQEEDWLVAGAAFIAGLGLIGMGLYNKIQGDSFGIVAIVFGAGCTFDATRDMLRFSRPITDQRAWLITHLTKMLGAYIATVSAVSAVNFQFLPPVWRWLWPTIIIGPMIFMWVQKYRSRTIENIKTPT